MSARWSWWWRVISSTRSARSPKRWRWAGRTSSVSRRATFCSESRKSPSGSPARSRREIEMCGRDRRQHVVARQQHAVLGHVEAQVAGRVAGRPHRVDVPARHVDPGAVVDAAVGRGERAEPPGPPAHRRRRRGGQLVLARSGVEEHGHQLVGEVRRRLGRPTVPSSSCFMALDRRSTVTASRSCIATHASDASRTRPDRPWWSGWTWVTSTP